MMQLFGRRLVTLMAFLTVMSASVPVNAQTAPSGTGSGVMDPTRIIGLCDHVFSRTRAPADSGVRFEYEQIIYAAAGVVPGDTPEQIRLKIQALWDGHQDRFKCSSNDFDVSSGSILKYAISARSFSFLNTASQRWQLNLNYVDSVDGRTMLDYLQEEIRRTSGSNSAIELQEYFDSLRQVGAKFSAEL